MSLEESTASAIDAEAEREHTRRRLRAMMLMRDAADLLGDSCVYVVAAVEDDGRVELILGQRGDLERIAALLDQIRRSI